MNWMFRSILVLNIAYCCFAMASDSLPAWMMFKTVDPIDFSLQDADGHSINVGKYLPRDVYITSPSSLLPLLSFICKKGEYRLPLQFDENVRDIHFEIGPDCEVPDGN